ncbi:MAG: CoA-binding protein [Chloroflexi bacterium]|nr:CoA-binding protein [Chloroflexota bacterium]
MNKAKDAATGAVSTMLHPRSIAIVGATSRHHFGGRFMTSLIEGGYTGKVYPVNPRYEELLGWRCYPTVSDLPEGPDLVAVIVAFEQTASVLEECARKGAKTAVIITAGYAELQTPERLQAQRALGEFARRTGVRLVGPNCLGLANVKDAAWACATTLDRIKATSVGRLALVSQSGASAFGPLLERAQDRGIGFSFIASTGNEADLEIADFIRYCLSDPDVDGVVTYIESIKDGDKFRKVAEEALAVGKPIVAMKIGRSEAGRRAALSHTAAVTGSDQVHDTLFRQCGVIRMDDWDELLETGSLLTKSPPFRKETLAVVAHSGGICTTLSDKCGQILDMPPLSPETRKGLEEILGGFGSAANPADITRFGHSEEFPRILEMLLDDDAFGGLVIGTAGDDHQAQQIIEAAASTDKPVLMLWSGSERATAGLRLLQQSKIPVFYRASNLARGLQASLDYRRARALRAVPVSPR